MVATHRLLRAVLTCALAAAAGTLSAVAQEKPPEIPVVPSRVDRVLLYSDRALIYRAGKIHLEAGRSRVAFEGLPSKLGDSSVAVAVLEPRDLSVKVANIEVEPVFKTTFRKEEAKKAADELKALQQQMLALTDQRAAIAAATQLTAQIHVGQRPGAQTDTKPLPLAPEAWGTALDFFDKGFRDAAQRDSDLVKKCDDLRAQIIVAAAKARALLSYKQEATKRVILEIAAERAGDCALEVSYMTPDAAWFPRYDVRADMKTGQLELTGYAVARQETGEDWGDATLEFSAAEPAHAADLPELMSWRISPAQPIILTHNAQVAIVAQPESVAQRSSAERGGANSPVAGYYVNAPADSANVNVTGISGNATGQTVLLQRQIEETQKAAQQGQGPAQPNAPMLSNSAKVEQRVQLIEQLDRQQKEAQAKGDWQTFKDANYRMGQNVQYFDGHVQWGETNNGYNLKLAERQLMAQSIARGLIAPVQSSGGYDYRWMAMRRESIPSDGALTKVVLFRRNFPADFAYEAAPEKTKMAFLHTRLTNDTRSPFLAGPVAVFLGSDFVGESALTTTAPTEKFVLGLGADEQIAVERQATQKRDTRGTFTTNYRFNVEVVTTVRNNKSKPVTVVVFERVPFTWDSKLEISAPAFSPAPTETDMVNKRPALAKWELTLAPGEKQEIRTTYWYQHGADRAVRLAEDDEVKW